MPDELPIAVVAIEDFYKLTKRNTDISLLIETGAEGQGSLTTIKINRKTIVRDIAGSMTEPLLIGKSNDLRGSILRVKTIISDLSKKTDDTSIRINITGGVQDYINKVEKTVGAEGESVLYTATIEFF
jgi:hypothetical protein